VSAVTSGGLSGLWLWSAADGVTRPLEGTQGAAGPFFAPDGGEVAFFAGGDLRRVPVEGGPVTTIASGVGGSSGSWAEDGTILFVRPFGPDAGSTRFRLAAAKPRRC
jgi:hypothetical protein